MSDAPPDWAQEDASQPDYIANKDLAEKLRPILVNGKLVLDDTHESGPLELVNGRGVSLVVDGNRVIINTTNPGSEEPGESALYVAGDGILIQETSDATKAISIDEGYINKTLIKPVLEPLERTLGETNDSIAILIGEDANLSIRAIATDVADRTVVEKTPAIVQEIASKDIASWVTKNTELAEIIETVNNLEQIVNIDEPITKYLEDTLPELVGEITLSPASSTVLGGVKIDDKTIKMNDKQQIYISKISTDDIELGEKTLVLNGGNDL